jgi:hypothetical protein
MKEDYLEGLDENYLDTWIRRDSVLAKHGFTYREFLVSDHWRQIKKKAAQRSNYQKCTFCNCTNVELHHTSYKWLFTKDELRNIIALCRKHHEEIHDYAKDNDMSVRIATNILRSRYNATKENHMSKLKKYMKYFSIVREEYVKLLKINLKEIT